MTQTASAIQNPLTSADSPTRGPPSGVNEKTPLKPESTFAERSEGSSSWLYSHAGAKSSSVNGSIEGIDDSPMSSWGRSRRSTGIGR